MLTEADNSPVDPSTHRDGTPIGALDVAGLPAEVAALREELTAFRRQFA